MQKSQSFPKLIDENDGNQVSENLVEDVTEDEEFGEN